jgi:hypothetical protein
MWNTDVTSDKFNESLYFIKSFPKKVVVVGVAAAAAKLLWTSVDSLLGYHTM